MWRTLPQSNQRGIETHSMSHNSKAHGSPQSNQRGIETKIVQAFARKLTGLNRTSVGLKR